MSNDKEIQLPPFYIGQRVVALKTKGNSLGIFIEKGKEYTVKDIEALCECGYWMVDAGFKAIPNHGGYCECGKYLSNSIIKNQVWISHVLFAPIQESFESISYSKVMEKESSAISVN